MEDFYGECGRVPVAAFTPGVALLAGAIWRNTSRSAVVASLLTQPPIGAGFAVLDLPHNIRVSPYYLLRLRRRPLTPLALSLRDRLLAQSNRPDVARYYVSDA